MVSSIASRAQVETRSQITLLDLLIVLTDNLRMIVVGPLVVGLFALGYSFTIPPTFTANTKFLPPKQSGASTVLTGIDKLAGFASLTSGSISVNQSIAFLRSRTLQDRLVDRFKVMERPKIKYREEARRAISDGVFITAGKDGMITLEANDVDPDFAALLANSYVEELGNLVQQLSTTEAKQRRVFYEGQLNYAKTNFLKADQALKAVGIDSSLLKTNGAVVVDVAKLSGQITDQEIKIAGMYGYLTEAAPDYKQAKIELAAMHNQHTQVGKSAPTSTDEAAVGSEYVAKYRDYKYYETLFNFMNSQYDMARIDESREAETLQVVDIAKPPDLPSKPNKVRFVAIAISATGFLMLFYIFTRFGFNVAVKNPKIVNKLRRLNQSLTGPLRTSWEKLSNEFNSKL